MRLVDYLDARKESEAAFARRSGVPQKTVNRICAGKNLPLADTAHKIIEAAKAEPAPGGGIVDLEDLLGPSEPSEAAG